MEVPSILQTVLFSFHKKNSVSPYSSARITRVDETNVADVLDFQPPHYVDTFRRFLQQGDVGYYAYLDGKCCHRSWLQKGPKWVAINSFVQMKLGSNEGYIHYCETSPQARGKSIYPSVLSRIVEENKNLDNIFICVDAENAPSIRGVEKAGFRERERVEVRRILKIPLYRVFASSSSHRESRRSYRAFWPLVRRSLGLCRRLLAKALRPRRKTDGSA